MERDGGDEPTGVYTGPPLVHDTPMERDTSVFNAAPDTSVITVPPQYVTQGTVVPRDTQVTTLELMDIQPGATLGEFRIEGKIGEGGMGTVFSAVHPMIAKRAAIKILKHQLCRDKSMIERFIDEARVVNQIGHPNIVDIFAFGEMPDGRRYLAMEWLRGETLRERIKRGPMSITQMARIIQPLARALEAAHDQHVIHRDLKPENVFLVEIPFDEPHVKLLDFGIAKLADEKDRAGTENQILGSPAYMSPEQARNANEAGPMSDVYALGAIAFELLTGRPPFQSKNTIELVTAHLTEMPPRPSSIVAEIPDEIDRLLLEMLAKPAADRPSLSYIRSTLDLIRDPAEIVAQPRTIVARRRTEPPAIANMIDGEVSGASPRPTPPPNEAYVAVRFARKSEESLPLRVAAPVLVAEAARVAAPVAARRWPIVVVLLLLIGTAVGAILYFTL